MTAETFVPVAVARQRAASFKDVLSVTDRERLAALLALVTEDGRTTVGAVVDQLFPDANSGTANKALGRLVENLNEAAETEGIDLRVEISGSKQLGRNRTIGFTATHVELPQTRLTEYEQVRDNFIEDRVATEHRPKIQIFLSWARADKPEARKLWDRLKVVLGNSSSYTFELWSFDDSILVGDDWDDQIRTAMERADVAIYGLSHDFLASSYITEVELPAFVNQADKWALPVMLDDVPLSSNVDLKGLGEKQIFRGGSEIGPIAYAKARGNRHAWVDALVAAVHARLQRDGMPADASDADASADAPQAKSRSDQLLIDPADMGATERDSIVREYPLFAARGGVADPAIATDARGRVNALDRLYEWATDEDGTTLAALLGEYGMGKTITCQALVARLRDASANEPGVPRPLYFDLREIQDLRVAEHVPSMHQILNAIIDKSWDRSVGLDAANMCADAAAQPTLFVFDGLDEVLVHLDTSQGIAFTRELLKLRPQQGRDQAPTAGTHTKVLISCRTHYFPSLDTQRGHFTEQGRDRTSPDDYLALTLLPLDQGQIETYLHHALPDVDVDHLTELLASVHDLDDLTRRPFTLARVAEEIPAIERARAAGSQVFASTIYDGLARRWLVRDGGKHRLDSDDKLALMGRLAAWAWERGGRLVASRDLDRWLHRQLAEPEFADRYAKLTSQELEQDLRTATFMVRVDTDDERTSGFRFAHTSIQEYFLARYLFDAIADGRREAWAIPTPNRESLHFLGQMLAEHPQGSEFVETLRSWRAPYVEGASETLLAYCLFAANNWRAPPLNRVDLSGADLRRLQVVGTAERPVAMRAANLRGTDLRFCDWSHVDLNGADLTGARLDNATLNSVTGARVDLSEASLRGALLRDTSLADHIDATADTTQARAIRCGPPTPPASVDCANLVPLAGHTSSVQALSWSPDGTHLAIGNADNTTIIYDITNASKTGTWEPTTTLTGHTNSVQALSWSPDGTHLATGSYDTTTIIWDTTTWEPTTTLTGHTNSVQALSWSPDGTQLATGSYDHTTIIWDTTDPLATTTWEPTTTLTGHTNWVHALSWSPDGTHLATGSADNTTIIWDTTTWEPTTTLTGHTYWVRALSWSPDGTQLATGSADNTTIIYDTTTWEPTITLTGHTNSVLALSWSPDGTHLAIGNTDNTTIIYDTTNASKTGTWEPTTTLTGHTDWVLALSWSPDGTHLATGSYDNTTIIYDTTTWEPTTTLTGHTGWVQALSWSPNGTHLATGSADNTTIIYDTTTWEPTTTLTGHTDWVQALNWSPDGTHLATGSDDITTIIYDTTNASKTGTWEPTTTLTGHTGWVQALSWSPDGTHLATGSADNTTIIYDTTTWEGVVRAAHLRDANASWRLVGPQLIHASEHAWRSLRVELRDPETREHLGSYPYEMVPSVLPDS